MKQKITISNLLNTREKCSICKKNWCRRQFRHTAPSRVFLRQGDDVCRGRTVLARSQSHHRRSPRILGRRRKSWNSFPRHRSLSAILLQERRRQRRRRRLRRAASFSAPKCKGSCDPPTDTSNVQCVMCEFNHSGHYRPYCFARHRNILVWIPISKPLELLRNISNPKLSFRNLSKVLTINKSNCPSFLQAAKCFKC